MVNILILYPKSDIAKSGKFPCVTASPQKEKTVMSRFEISQKSKGLLLRETEKPTSILCFTQDTNKLNVDIISSDSMNFITDFECYGVLGLYHLSGALYLEVITKVETIGKSYSGNPVYRVAEVELLQIPGGENVYADVKYLEMLQDVLKITNIYFSNHEDLTKRLQESLCEPLSEEDHIFPSTMNEQFMFNYPIIGELAPFKSLFPRDLIPIAIFGYMSIISSINIHSHAFNLTLISRRSIYRNGRRFNTRGADEQGHVANYVESEQILQKDDGHVYSFVQVRGSIPLEWTQKPYLKYTPKIVIHDDITRLSLHFDQLVKKYGKVVVVNLIDTKKDQLMIGEEYERACLQ